MNQLLQMPEIIAPSISSSAMTVSLKISFYTGRKKDKKATRDAEVANGTDKGVANLTKALLGSCPELKAINDYAGEVRNHIHYRMTMPWTDGDARLLTTAVFADYHNQITEAEIKFNKLVAAFLKVYDWKVIQSQAKLGAMFRKTDYLTKDEVASKFAFRVAYDELPDGGNTGDWRLDLPHEAMEDLRANFASNHEQRLKGAMDELWKRLHKNLTTLVHELDVNEDGKGNKLYPKVFDRAIELTDMLRTCNVTGDSQMEAMRRQLEDVLRNQTVQGFKNSPSVRADTQSKLAAALAALPSLDM